MTTPLLFVKAAMRGDSHTFDLFDTPVTVAPSVRSDGTVVQGYTRVQKVKRKEAPKAKQEATGKQSLPVAPERAESRPSQASAPEPAQAQTVGGGSADEGPKEGDTKSEGGVNYVLRDGRWHRAEPDARATEFHATHELSDGTPVVAHPDDPGVWVDEHGDEYEATDEVLPIQQQSDAGTVASTGRAQVVDPPREVADVSGPGAEPAGDTVGAEDAVQGGTSGAVDRGAEELAERSGVADKPRFLDDPRARWKDTGAITSDDPRAIEKLSAKLAHLEWRQEMMKLANKHIRAGKDDALREMGFTDDQIAKLKEKDFAGRIGFPDYAITNNGAQIRTITKRMMQLARDGAQLPTADEPMADAELADEVEPAAFDPGEPIPLHTSDTNFGVKPGIGKAARRKINAQCRDILARGAPYSDDDLATLRQYSGEGGVGDSLNEFYTPAEVAAGVWTALRMLGLRQDAKVLEPSCGPGVFLHTAPTDVSIQGVELDKTSSKIAGILHPRHSIANQSLERFAWSNTDRYDAVVGNPPYGLRGGLIVEDKPYIKTAEQYFIDTAVDKANAGGLIALVIPSTILDSKNGKSFRESINKRAEFLGAMRMPNSAFEASHTNVTTDVLFLRKRPDDVAGALGAIDVEYGREVGAIDDEFVNGQYFSGSGSNNILGAEGTAKRAFGDIYAVTGSMEGVPEAIAGFVPKDLSGSRVSMEGILRAIGDNNEYDKGRALGGATTRPYEQTARAGDTKEVDGVKYILQGKPPRWHRLDDFLDAPDIAAARDLGERIDNLMKGQDEDRAAVERDLRAYLETHGMPSKNAALLLAAKHAPALHRLIGAVNAKGELSDVVTGRVKVDEKGTFETTVRAMSLDQGGATADEIAERTGMDREAVLDHLHIDPGYAYLPGDRWASNDVYMTGLLWPKYDDTVKMLEDGTLPDTLRAKLESQQKALMAEIDPKSLDEVDITMATRWVGTKLLSEFLTQKFAEQESAWKNNKSAPVNITFADGVYKVEGGQIWRMKDIDRYLNRNGLRREKLPDIEDLNREFKEWLCSGDHRQALEDKYNRIFRGFKEQIFSVDPIDIPGLANQDKIKPHVWSGVKWALQAGKGVLADDVGLGKTVQGLMLGKLMKLTGRAKRPVFVVPKAVLANWYAEAEKWFPGSRVLTIGGSVDRNEAGELIGKDDTAADRDRKMHDMMQNDYDFVFMSEPAFEKIDLDPVTKWDYESQDFWNQRGKSLGNAGNKKVRAAQERAEQARRSADYMASFRTGAGFFNELGVDALIYDEAHHCKTLATAKQRFGETPRFLGSASDPSARALDLNLKARWILNQQDKKNVYLLTATPTKNSPLEIYSMISHVAPEAFESIGIQNSEEFLDRFAKFTETNEFLSTSGEIKKATITSGFKNMDELREIMEQHINRRTADDVGLKLPDRDDRQHFVEMDSAQKREYENYRQMLEDADDKSSDHIFSIMSQMQKAAMDLTLLDDKAYPDHASPKYAACAKVVAENMKEGGQVVFSDSVQSHERFVNALVAAGVPRKQIGVLNADAAKSAVDRQKISDAFNAGKLKVVVGNTPVMGEGINLQMGTTDIHHLDIPWEPASIQQRNGRGLRQGNTSAAVRIHTYLSKQSFDGYRWQSSRAKRDWQDMVWNGGDTVENLNRPAEVSHQDLLIMMAADPEAARAKFESDREAQKAQIAAAKRAEATVEFSKFQALRSSYEKLKNKNTPSAAMLKTKIDRSRLSLERSEHFPHKALLSGDKPVLINENSGIALYAGVGIASDGEPDRYVVTGVDTDRGNVAMRSYGSLTPKTIAVPLSKFDHGVSTFDFDQAAETEAISKAMAAQKATDEAAATERAQRLDHWDKLRTVPENALIGLRDDFQARMWDGAKTYKFGFPYGKIPMLNRETGKPEMREQYELQKLGPETHEFLLPTQKDMRHVIDGWKESERSKKFGQTSFQRRKNSRSEWRNSVQYDGSFTQEHNPWESALRGMSRDARTPSGAVFGDVSEKKAAEAELRAEQYARISKAKNMQDALKHAIPLTTLAGEGNKPEWDKRALAMLWAKAKKLGVLGTTSILDHRPMEVPKHYPTPMRVHDDYLFNHGSSHTYGSNPTMHQQLMGLASMSGHMDLRNAMAIHGASDVDQSFEDAVATLNKTGKFPPGDNWRKVYPKQAIDAYESLAKRHGKLDEHAQKIAEMRATLEKYGEQNAGA